MNSDEVWNLVKQVLTLASGIAVGAGLLTADQGVSLVNDIVLVIPAVIGASSIVWSVYSHWNMKKVPVAATAIITPEKAPLPVGEHLSIPGVGLAKVVA
jgi:hypothetical protein